MSTAEVSEVAADQPSKLVKEKKTKAASKVNKTKSAKTASHPPYFEMIKEALLALKEKGGSSPYAIAKYIEENQKVVLPSNFRKILGLQLKNSAAKGKLIKVKASYKLSESGKKDKAAVAKPLPKVAIAKKKVEKAKKAVATKGALKMKPKTEEKVKKAKAGLTPSKSAQKTKKKRAATPAKVKKAKQPKSIKSPAAKKAKKAAT